MIRNIWWHGPPLDVVYAANLQSTSSWTWERVNAMIEGRTASPLGHSPPPDQVIVVWRDGEFTLCMPEMRLRDEVSRAVLLFSAFMVKATKDKNWVDRLIAEVFPDKEQ